MRCDFRDKRCRYYILQKNDLYLIRYILTLFLRGVPLPRYLLFIFFVYSSVCNFICHGIFQVLAYSITKKFSSIKGYIPKRKL